MALLRPRIGIAAQVKRDEAVGDLYLLLGKAGVDHRKGLLFLVREKRDCGKFSRVSQMLAGTSTRISITHPFLLLKKPVAPPLPLKCSFVLG
jgi:hypothetical protein